MIGTKAMKIYTKTNLVIVMSALKQRRIKTLTLLCVLLGLIGPVHTMAFTEVTCTFEEAEYWQSTADVMQLANDSGYAIEYLETTAGNCYAASVVDENGATTELFFDPVSGALVHTNYVNQ